MPLDPSPEAQEGEKRGSLAGSAVTGLVDLTERRAMEARVLASEARYRTLFGSIHQGFALTEVLFDALRRPYDARFIEVNPAFEAQIGLSAVVGKTLRELAEYDAIWQEQYALLAVGGGTVRIELESRVLARWFDLHVFRVGENSSHVAILLTDITARKQSELLLREAQTRLLAAASGASVGTWTWDVRKNQVFADSYLARFFRVDHPTANGGPLEAYVAAVHPDDRANVQPRIAASLASGSGYECEYRLRDHNGGWRWFQARGQVERGGDGHAERFVGALIDINERKQQEEKVAELSRQLAAQAAIFDATLSHITDFAYTFDRDGRFRFVNQALLSLWGLPLEAAIGRNFFDLNYPPELATRLHSQIQTVIETKQDLRDETRYTSPTGASGYYEYIFSPIFSDDGTVEAVAGSTRDITERKRTEESLRASEERLRTTSEELLETQQELEHRVIARTKELDRANLELQEKIRQLKDAEVARQGLRRQLAFAQEDERRRLSRELHDDIGQRVIGLSLSLKALEAAEDRADIIKQVQELQRGAGSLGQELHRVALALRPTALDDSGLVGALSNYIPDWSTRTGIIAAVHFAGLEGKRLPGVLEITIFRIVQEALTNVMKHARATHVSVVIERRPEHALVIIEDNGQGFDADSSATLPATRLGLLGMRERASLVDGELKVESSSGGGTTVFLRVPLSPPPPYV